LAGLVGHLPLRLFIYSISFGIGNSSSFIDDCFHFNYRAFHEDGLPMCVMGLVVVGPRIKYYLIMKTAPLVPMEP
jgi:hypothetical protein